MTRRRAGPERCQTALMGGTPGPRNSDPDVAKRSRGPLSVAVVDDVDLSAEGATALLGRRPDAVEVVRTVVGRTVVSDAVGEGVASTADVALVDGYGSPRAGLDRCREVMSEGQATRVVLHAWRVTPALAVEAIGSGVAGVLSKTLSADALIDAIERIAEGETVVSDFPFHPGDARRPTPRADGLTGRETELLVLVAEGLSNAEIAAAMYLAESSVKTYLKRIYRKLGINSRSQAAMAAVELGLAGPDAGPNAG